MSGLKNKSSTPIPADIDVPIVEYWEDLYLQKYPGDCTTESVLSSVDHKTLYTGLDSLLIKVTGESTGVDGSEWFKLLEAPDYRSPFPDMVSKSHVRKSKMYLKKSIFKVNNFVRTVNVAAQHFREDNFDWKPKSVLGIGPSRGYFFLSNEVIRGAVGDGFHRNEGPLLGKYNIKDNSDFFEYPGFTCANRKFRVS